MNQLTRKSNYANTFEKDNQPNDEDVLVAPSHVSQYAEEDARGGSVDDRVRSDASLEESYVAEGVMVPSSHTSNNSTDNFLGMEVRTSITRTGVELDDNGFETYIIPVQSTDYKGLEAIDPRLVDREWRLDNLYKVINEAGEIVQFKLRPAQKKLLREMHYKNIILKARQLGFTTFICIFLLDYALFNRNKQIGIIGPTQNDTSVIFRKIKVAWESFPDPIKKFLGLSTLGDSKVEYEFTNGSIMRIATSLRSGTYQAVLITEFGKICSRFPDKAEEIITGTLPAVPANGLIFIESTAEGEDGPYYDMVQDAMEAKKMQRVLTTKEYKFFFFPWYDNPADVVAGDVPISSEVNEYLNKVERITMKTLTKEQRNWYYLEGKIQKFKMKQEHPSTPDEAFLTSGNKLFEGQMIDTHRELYVADPIAIEGDFVIYKRFVKSHVYGLGADVSQGVKRDSSTIAVIDFTTGELVMTYRSNEIDPVTFAHDIKKAALMYGGCIAAPEANNVGLTTCVTLHSIYPNIYTQQREGTLEITSTNKLGWLTTTLTKPKMMYELSEAIGDENIRIYDESVLLEAKRMNKEDTLQVQFAADSMTRHFDLVTAVAIAWQMRAYVYRGKAEAGDVAKVEERRERNLTRTKGKYR